MHSKYLAVVTVDDEREMLATEMYYMGLFDPVFNKQLRPRGRRFVAHIDDVRWDPDRRLWAVSGSSAFLDRTGKPRG